MTDEPKAPDIPYPPAMIGRCEQCVWWLERLKADMVQTPQGPVPIEIARQQSGGILPAHIRPQVMAPCTCGPVWLHVRPDWWCGRWKRRLDG